MGFFCLLSSRLLERRVLEAVVIRQERLTMNLDCGLNLSDIWEPALHATHITSTSETVNSGCQHVNCCCSFLATALSQFFPFSILVVQFTEEGLRTETYETTSFLKLMLRKLIKIIVISIVAMSLYRIIVHVLIKHSTCTDQV